MKESYIDALLSWLMTPEDERKLLTPKLQDIHSRIMQVAALKRQHYLDSIVVRLHMSASPSLSQAQAYRDLRDAKYIMGMVEDVNTNFERAITAERVQKAMVRAELDGDLKALKGLTDTLIKLRGWDKAQTAPIDPRRFRPAPREIGYFPELVQGDEKKIDAADFIKRMQRLQEPPSKEEDYTDFDEL